ncbi:hypothetical protein KIPB_012520, partial [Kipferlia bialata]
DSVSVGARMDAALDGGDRGRQVVDVFVAGLASVLSPSGVAYVIAIRQNDVADMVCDALRHGLRCRPLARRRIPGEILFVLEYTHSGS